MGEFPNSIMELLNRPRLNVQSAFAMSNLPPKVQSHLVDVYKAVGATVAAASAGAYLHLKMHIGSTWWTLALVGLIFALHGTPNTPANAQKRWGMLLGFGALQGLVVGPLVEQVLAIDAGIVVSAMLATTLVFACFSLAALYAERRSMLFMGGFLSSALTILLFASLFGAPFNLQLYGGLLLFIGYVCFDTQMIVEKAAAGNYDVVGHALELFLDLVSIFIRILIIIARNKKDKKNERRR